MFDHRPTLSQAGWPEQVRGSAQRWRFAVREATKINGVEYSSAVGIVIRIAVGLAGISLALATFLSAIKLVVVPKGTSQRITRFVFTVVRGFLRVYARPRLPWVKRDHRLAFYAPVSLVLLPIAWVSMIIVGFAGIHWALDPRSLGVGKAGDVGREHALEQAERQRIREHMRSNPVRQWSATRRR